MPPPSAISPARPHMVHSPTVGTAAATALTVWLTAADTLFGQPLLEVYEAVTLRVPAVGKTRLAVTEELPALTVVSAAVAPKGVAPSRNCTEPKHWAAEGLVTVAVRLTDAPTVEGFGLWLVTVVTVPGVPARAVEATRAEAKEAAMAAERNFSIDTFEKKSRGTNPRESAITLGTVWMKTSGERGSSIPVLETGFSVETVRAWSRECRGPERSLRRRSASSGVRWRRAGDRC